MRTLVISLVLAAMAHTLPACICVPAPPKWVFKSSGAVLVVDVESVSPACVTSVKVKRSFKGPVSPGVEVPVFAHSAFACGCPIPEKALVYLYRDGNEWMLGGCEGVDVEKEPGRERLRQIEHRGWWWRSGLSSISLYPLRMWWRNRP